MDGSRTLPANGSIIERGAEAVITHAHYLARQKLDVDSRTPLDVFHKASEEYSGQVVLLSA